MNKCKKCGGVNCTCKKNIHELAKEYPYKTYKQLEQEQAEQETYERHSKTTELIIDSTNDCEGCQ